MEMFVLSYVNILCIYPRLSSSWFLLKAQNQLDKPVFYLYLVLLIYVHETIYLLGNLPFFKIHVNHFMAWDDSPAANVPSVHVVGEGPGAIL